MLFVRHTQQQMRNIGLMVFMMRSLKTAKQKTEASDTNGDNGTGSSASSDESPENGEGARGGSQQQLANIQAVHSKGWLFEETVSGKITGIALAAAWEAERHMMN